MKPSTLLLLTILLTLSTACIDAPPNASEDGNNGVTNNNGNNLECSSGKELCAGECITPQDDPENCGGCGTLCPEIDNALSEGCDEGTCRYSCPTGFEERVGDEGFECVDCALSGAGCQMEECDGPKYNYFLDADGDGFGGKEIVESCEDTPPAGLSLVSDDCDDANEESYPDAIEDCLVEDADLNCDGFSNCYDATCFGANQGAEGVICPLIMFVTKSQYMGDFDGVAGGSAICQDEAAGIWSPEIEWRAVLSDTASAAVDEIVHERPVDLPTGTRFAAPLQLFSGRRVDQARPSIHADGSKLDTAVSAMVWTGSTQDGQVTQTNCGGWESTAVSYEGAAGDAYSSANWLSRPNISIETRACSQMGRLYCISQL